MSKNIKQGKVPELRFPEFRNEPDWEETTIGKLGSFYYGKSAPKWSLERDAPTPCVRYGELYTKFGCVISETYSRTNIEPNKLRFSKGGEILVPRVGERPEEFGKCCSYLPLANIAIGEMISVFETSENPLFYTYYFRRMYRQFAEVVEGQNVKNLYYTELEPLTIFKPDPEEQQKIADCLRSLDELITVHTQKHQALQSYKKGLLQNLFPSEGETVPILRFPEFEEAGDWKCKPLKKVFSIFQGFAFSSKDAINSGARWLKIADVGIQEMNHNTPSYLPLEHKAKHKKYLVNKGDYVVALTRPILSGRLKIAPVDDVFHGALLNQRVGKIVAVQNSLFVYYLLQTKKLISDIERSIAGSEPPNLSAQQIEDIETYIPSVEEQKVIGSFLSSVDDLIKAQSQKIEKLNAHKKGLMQQLFPAVDEVRA